MEWRIYYDDNSTFDNSHGKPWEAPGRGVVCVVQIDPSPLMHSVNTQVLQSHPFYWYHRGWGYWMGSDRDGAIDQLTNDRKNEVCAIKMGRWVDYHHYREIVDKAREDQDFPKKSGVSRAEKRYKG